VPHPYVQLQHLDPVSDWLRSQVYFNSLLCDICKSSPVSA